MTTPSASIPLVSTIFGLTYLALALGKVPGLRIDRAGIALVGAAAMLACGALSMHDAAKAVDYETIVLLFGMMVVVAYLRMAGFFALATERIAARFSGPLFGARDIRRHGCSGVSLRGRGAHSIVSQDNSLRASERVSPPVESWEGCRRNGQENRSHGRYHR